MSLKFILGESRSGKSSCLFDMVIKKSLADPDSNYLLIVPEQYTLQTQKKITSLHPSHAVMNIDILSFERLAYRVFDETGTSVREILDKTGKSMIIRRLLDQNKDNLHAFAGSIGRRGFTDQAESMISELIEYDISPDTLHEKMPAPGRSPRLYAKLKDIEFLYRKFLEFLGEKYMTSEELLGVLCDVIDRSENIRHSEIFMDNFTGFTPLQYRLVEKLLCLSPSVTLTLCVDKGSIFHDPSDKDGLFHITGETMSRLEAVCAMRGVGRDRDIVLSRRAVPGRKPDLEALEAGIFRPEHSVYEGKPENIIIRRCASPDEEMYLTAMSIHSLVRTDNIRYSQIAIVTGDMERYIPAARKWLERYGIPCFFDTRKSISANMLIEWMRSLLGTLQRDYKYENVFRFLRSGMGPLAREEVDELENYVLAYGIRGRRKWNRSFEAGKNELGSEKLERINSFREKFISSLAPFKGMTPSGRYPAADIVRSLYLCMEKSHIHSMCDEKIDAFESSGDLERAREYDQIYDSVIDLLEKIYMILGDEELNIGEFSDVLESGISEIKLGIIPPGIDQVMFGDLKRTRLDDVKALFFVGVNDSVIPGLSHPAGLISDPERDILSDSGIELAPTSADSLRAERFYLYSCMTKPSEKLVISYAAADSDGSEMTPSTLIRQIKEIFPELKETFPDIHGMADVLSAYEYIKDSLASLAGGNIEQPADPDSDFIPIYRWFLDKTEYRGRVLRLVDAVCGMYTGDRLSSSAVNALYNGKLTGGVTMLERYASCPYSHFLTYGMNLDTRKVYEVTPPDIGLIFHAAMERLSRRIAQSGMNWRDIPDDLRDRWTEEAVRSVAENYGNNIMQDTGRARFLTDSLCELAKLSVWALQQQIRKGDFDPEEYEAVFSLSLGNGASFSAEGDAGKEGISESADRIRLNGKIDRVDVCEDNGSTYLRVIDYKTGKEDFRLDMIFYGLKLQLMVYMNAACDSALKRRGGRIVPAGVFYYNVDEPELDAADIGELNSGRNEASDAENNASSDTSFAGVYSPDETAILEKLAMKGLVADDEDAIRHLDNRAGEKPKIMPLSVNKDGSISKTSSVAAPDDFYLLRRFTDSKCLNLGRNILSGEISARPYKMKDRTACDYCAYRPVCGFTTGVPGYYYRKLKEMKSDEVLLRMAGEISREAEHSSWNDETAGPETDKNISGEDTETDTRKSGSKGGDEYGH